MNADGFGFEADNLKALWDKLPSSVPGYVAPRARRGETVKHSDSGPPSWVILEPKNVRLTAFSSVSTG